MISSIFSRHEVGLMPSRVKRPENIKFGRRLRVLREQRGYSQGQVALWFNVSNKAISSYESGGAEFPSRFLPLLAKKLDCNIGYFFDEDHIDSPSPGDQEWLGYIGRKLAQIPPGPVRDQYKDRLRNVADTEARFMLELLDKAFNK